MTLTIHVIAIGTTAGTKAPAVLVAEWFHGNGQDKLLLNQTIAHLKTWAEDEKRAAENYDAEVDRLRNELRELEQKIGVHNLLLHADQSVDPAHPFQQRGPVPLDEAACHHDAPTPTFALELHDLPDRVDRFVARRRQEAASVHHDRVRVTGVIGDQATGFGHLAEHLLRVHHVLDAAQ